MRELKFRVWDNLKKEWLKNKVYHFNLFCNEIGIGEFRLNQHPEGFTIQQYTGLKDKNGKEIYEGDILKVKITDEVIPTNNGRKINACVCWDNFHACWIVEGKIEKGLLNGEQYPFGCNENCYIDYHSPVAVDAKIIGNIFENPELLEQTALA